MQIVRTIAEARAALRNLRSGDRAIGRTIGLVPTMGALHAGHLSLVQAAKASCNAVAVSIFVNPTQFGPNEDFAKYPRTFAADCEQLRQAGVDLLFAPLVEEMYPKGASTFVEVEDLSNRLDGASRPGHFRGVATIVAKLFHVIGPDKAFFGQKDAAQVAVLRKMVHDLDFPLELIVCPIVREPDRLAMSSRNRYLSPEERRQALVLHRAIQTAEQKAKQGETSAAILLEAAYSVLAEESAVRIDYCKLVDPDTLEAVSERSGPTLLAIAAFVGTTRLIDNTLLPSAQ